MYICYPSFLPYTLTSPTSHFQSSKQFFKQLASSCCTLNTDDRINDVNRKSNEGGDDYDGNIEQQQQQQQQIGDLNRSILFETAESGYLLLPHRKCNNPDELRKFEAIGRVMAKCAYDGRGMIPSIFPRFLFKHFLGMKPTFSDLEQYSPEDAAT